MTRNGFCSIAQLEMPIQKEPQGLIGHNAFTAWNGLYHTRDEIHDLWYHMIGIYGGLNLTKITNKLPDIAGIDREVQLRTGDKYSSGNPTSNVDCNGVTSQLLYWRSRQVHGLRPRAGHSLMSNQRISWAFSRDYKALPQNLSTSLIWA